METEQLLKKIREQEQIIHQLEVENALKTKWLSLLTHDFKGSFSNLVSLIEVLEDESISKEMFISLMAELKLDAQINLQSIQDTSAWIKTQSPVFTPLVTDINALDLFSSIRSILHRSIESKNISFAYVGDEGFNFQADRVLVTFILKKLVENAIKFSPIGEKVLFYVSKLPDQQYKLTVEDFGAGMSQRALKDLGTFNRSIYTGTEGEKGAGLSLIIVSDFVKMLGGSMQIYSVENVGTKIEIVLPVFVEKGLIYGGKNTYCG